MPGGLGRFAGGLDRFAKGLDHFARVPERFARGPGDFAGGPERFAPELGYFAQGLGQFDRGLEHFAGGPERFARDAYRCSLCPEPAERAPCSLAQPAREYLQIPFQAVIPSHSSGQALSECEGSLLYFPKREQRCFRRRQGFGGHVAVAQHDGDKEGRMLKTRLRSHTAGRRNRRGRAGYIFSR